MREFRYVKFHGMDVVIPGIGSLGTTMPPTNKTVKLRMYETALGVLLSFNNGSIESVVPWANVQLATYAPEDKPQVKVAQSA